MLDLGDELPLEAIANDVPPGRGMVTELRELLELLKQGLVHATPVHPHGARKGLRVRVRRAADAVRLGRRVVREPRACVLAFVIIRIVCIVVDVVVVKKHKRELWRWRRRSSSALPDRIPF